MSETEQPPQRYDEISPLEMNIADKYKLYYKRKLFLEGIIKQYNDIHPRYKEEYDKCRIAMGELVMQYHNLSVEDKKKIDSERKTKPEDQ